MADLLDWDDLDMVVASACAADVPSSDAPDEFLGIGFGLLHAGAQSVISPSREINDTPAALLMARLYHERGRGHQPASALRLAQTWVRDVDTTTLVALAARAGEGARSPGTRWLPALLATRLADQLRDAVPAVRSFRHPIDRAAFTYLGA